MKSLFIDQTIDKIDQTVELYGWVATIRDHKKIIFIDLRDRTALSR
jgi:aspartyl-tRNA synthetase